MSINKEAIIKWYSPTKVPFKIYGFPFFDEEGVYRRMRLNPPKPIPEMVNILANETSGGQIRFSARLKKLKIKVELAKLRTFYPHLTTTASCGFDCYVKEKDEFCYYSTSMIDPANSRYVVTMIDLNEEKQLDIILNFPLYCGVDKVLIGVDENALIYPPKKFSTNKRLVLYGGSIIQGACASRPGMSSGNILSRWLDMEVIDLGFDASGKAEAEMAECISEIPNTELLLITDIEANCPDDIWLKEKLHEFIKIYRKCQPETPIIIKSLPPFAKECILEYALNSRLAKKAIQSDIVKFYNNSGDDNIYFLDGEKTYNEIFEGFSIGNEMTVDGSHMTDLGFINQSKGLYTFIKEILKD